MCACEQRWYSASGRWSSHSAIFTLSMGAWIVDVTVEIERVRSFDICSSRSDCLAGRALALVDHIGDAVWEHPISSCKHVKRFPKQNDLAVGRRAVAEEALMNELSGDPRLLVNGIFTKRLIRSVDVDLHVDELKVRIHLLVQESKKGFDVLWAFIARIDS